MTSQEASVPEDKSEDKGLELQESADRHKRSGDLVGYLGNKLQSKVSAFASASGALSSLSAGSKHEYGPPVSYECNKRGLSGRQNQHTSRSQYIADLIGKFVCGNYNTYTRN